MDIKRFFADQAVACGWRLRRIIKAQQDDLEATIGAWNMGITDDDPEISDPDMDQLTKEARATCQEALKMKDFPGKPSLRIAMALQRELEGDSP